MTIQLHRHDHRAPESSEDESGPQVAVRRNVVLSGVVGGAALLLAVAFLARGSSASDVFLGLVLVLVAGFNLPAVVSARTPVLVADDYGIRLRVGLGWRGLPWTAIRQLVVEDPASLLREGRLVIVPGDRKAAFRRLDKPARWHLRWNKYWYGTSLSIPLGITTATDSADLAADLSSLAAGRVEVVHVSAHERQWTEAEPAARAALPEPLEPLELFVPDQPVPDEDGEPVAVEVDLGPQLPEPVLPLRDLSTPARIDVRLEPRVADDTVDQATQVTRVESLVTEELPVEILIDDLAVVNPVAAPIIGAKVSHARECLDMSIDELAQRTRIRPHVLEAIEQDDFGPCGGDFYARGHLTAISRALGLTLDPLLAIYDERYAQAPINARRVFEAELSSGLSGGVRATLAGPRWSLLIGSVLSLTMIWGLARIFAGDADALNAAPPPAQSAGLAGNQTPITSPRMRTTPMTVTAAYASTHVVVKDRTGKTLWSGDLGIGRKRKVVGLAPFTVSADNAGAVVVSVKGKPMGDLGTAGEAGSKAFG
ncbi:MAG: DUF4115 domain-containing protein [Propionibacteriales bacterium]|nr:DUF4115 domain-containing protein [Propionibacteriales bacterium]